jgi:hypothetical protein
MRPCDGCYVRWGRGALAPREGVMLCPPCVRLYDESPVSPAPDPERPRGGWLARVATNTLPPVAHGARAFSR